MLASAAMTPFDPATRASRQKFDLPAMAVKEDLGSEEATLWSLPTLPHVNLGARLTSIFLGNCL